VETVEKQVSLALAAIGAVTLLVVGLAYREAHHTTDSVTWLLHSHEVLAALDGVLEDMTDAQFHARRSIATGDRLESSAYVSSQAQIRQRLDRLLPLTSDNPRQQARLRALERLNTNRLRFEDSAISMSRKTGPEVALQFLRSDAALGAIQAMRQAIAEMSAEENALLRRRQSEYESSRRKTPVILLFLGTSVLILLVSAYYILERDLWSRILAHDALRQSADELRDLYDNAPCGYLSLDSSGALLRINATLAAWLGYSREEVLQIREARPFLTSESVQKLDAAFAGFKEHGRIEELGLDMVRKTGSVMPILLTADAIRDSSGRYVSCRGTVFDITGRKESEDRLLKTVRDLKRSNDELQQFAYVASHDLQEPLRMVASYTQLLAQRYKGRLDSDADEFMAYAVDGSNRMQKLIQDLLAYSRVGKTGIPLREISSEHALTEALGHLRATIAESCAVVTHDELPAVTTNKTHLTQVFQNLVGNAIKYHGADAPCVHISAVKNGANQWVFSVRDNGLGIDPQYFERIFVLFQRLHGPKEFKGTGIGLAICKKIMEQLGGKIWVESQLGEGSTFCFALPEREGNSGID
jgi:PAS domain S-box-containing protein